MLLRELFEAPGKTAALAFGRLNPPTIGHAKLVDAITAQDGDHYLFLSQTQKPKTDPLDFATKMKLAKQFFPSINIGHQAVRTPVQALEQLQSLGYTDIVFIAGSDRVDGFQKLFDTYNGQPDKAGNVPFKFNSIKVVSAGERDPDADGAEGMSASKMRAAAAAGDLESFAQGAPDKKLAKTMYDAVRKGMGVKDEQPVEESNPFTDARMNAIKAGKSTFTVGGKTYKVTGDTSDEENAVDEGWKDKLAAAGLAGAMALGSGAANARVSPDQDPGINRLTGKPNATQVAPPKATSPKGFSKEYLQKAADPNRFGRYLISVEKAQELLDKMNGEVEEPSVAEGLFGIDSKTKGAIQNVVAKLSDIPGMWDFNADTFTDAGMDKLKSVLKDNPKHIKYALNLTADDFDADLESIDEILGFATKRPKTNTVKRRPPEPEQDSVQDKIKQRRAMASKVGTDKAFRHDSLKGK